MCFDSIATVDAYSSILLSLRFYAEGDSQTPSAVYYTLRDSEGAIINGKDNVSITPVSNVMDLFLDGDDLPNTTNTTVPIYLYVTFTYTSSIDGNDHSPIDKYLIYVCAP
jgi:hypothetical protein